MAPAWEEIEHAKKEKRHELSLHGAAVSERIEKEGLDVSLFSLTGLNHLEISGTALNEVHDDVGRLRNLVSLILRNNCLVTLPASIGKLQKLKVLDLSNNSIASLSGDVSALVSLESLNVSGNNLEEFPCVSTLTSLHILDLSHNKLQHLPEGICHPDLVHLSQIRANNNAIREIPADFPNIPHLNELDLSANLLQDVPATLSECGKLRELNLKGNSFRDRRLAKLVEQSSKKPLLDYLATNLDRDGKTAKQKKKKKQKSSNRDTDVKEDLQKNVIDIVHFPGEGGLAVTVTTAVLTVRPFIVCCLVKKLDFKKTPNMFKRFINLQTKLHDTFCQKRQVATIATHDMKCIKKPVVYDARRPPDIKDILAHDLIVNNLMTTFQIIPLFRSKEVTAEYLMGNLRREADGIRKEKKRNTLTGIYKYLDLLKDKTEYPCLLDGDGAVISFPPITNSDKTKISTDTTDVLIEVTSSVSLDTCKKIMDELIIDMLQMGVGSSDEVTAVLAPQEEIVDDLDPRLRNQKLILEQVHVVGTDGSLRVSYPSRTDLDSKAFKVIER